MHFIPFHSEINEPVSFNDRITPPIKFEFGVISVHNKGFCGAPALFGDNEPRHFHEFPRTSGRASLAGTSLAGGLSTTGTPPIASPTCNQHMCVQALYRACSTAVPQSNPLSTLSNCLRC